MSPVRLSGLKLVAKDRSPAWFVLSADHKFLYAINEVDNYGPNKSGSITAYAVGCGERRPQETQDTVDTAVRN